MNLASPACFFLLLTGGRVRVNGIHELRWTRDDEREQRLEVLIPEAEEDGPELKVSPRAFCIHCRQHTWKACRELRRIRVRMA